MRVCSAKLLAEIKDKLVERTRDRLESVRSQAVAGLGTLQAAGSQDEVVDEYMRLMDADTKKYGSKLQLLFFSSCVVCAYQRVNTLGRCARRRCPTC